MTNEIFKRHKSNPIITAEDLPYRAHSVFNAAAVKHEGETVLLLRVEDYKGHSHITAAKSKDGVGGWRFPESPSIAPDPAAYPEDEWGVEDPRVTYLEEEGVYAVVFVSFSRQGPLVSLALTEDFNSFERKGIILPPDDKDAALFPVKFGDRWAMIHRPFMLEDGLPAHIHLSYSSDLIHWEDKRVLIEAREGGWWDANKIGLNNPPLLTEHGWLVLYHGVRYTCAGCIYRVGLALLDRDNPEKVLRRSDEWVFGPQEDYEMQGDVGNVVFPCGWTVQDDELRLYYGAADTKMALATAKLADVMDYVLRMPEVSGI